MQAIEDYVESLDWFWSNRKRSAETIVIVIANIKKVIVYLVCWGHKNLMHIFHDYYAIDVWRDLLCRDKYDPDVHSIDYYPGLPTDTNIHVHILMYTLFMHATPLFVPRLT